MTAALPDFILGLQVANIPPKVTSFQFVHFKSCLQTNTHINKAVKILLS